MDLKKFTTEDEVNEERKRREAEWQRVRKPSDPVEAPSEVFDNRTLYDKLKEQNDIKKKEFEDQWAAKNQIRGIDTDEASFLDEIDRVKMRHEMIKKIEEKKELEEFKKAIEEEKKTSQQSAPKIHVTVQKKEKSQSELLSKVVVAKRKKNEDEEDQVENKRCKDTVPQKIVKPQMITAILPGVGEYGSNSSSSSDYSSDDEIIHKDTSSLFSSHGSSGAASGSDHSVSETAKTH